MRDPIQLITKESPRQIIFEDANVETSIFIIEILLTLNVYSI